MVSSTQIFSKEPPPPVLARRGPVQVYLDWDWLVVVVASWLLPLLGFNLASATYLRSECFWVLPILALLPRFLNESRGDARKRHAFFWTCGIILAVGSLLDLAFGSRILSFGPGPYLARWAGIPVEEFLFYLLGPIAMLLVYFWADEYFLKLQSRQILRLSLDASALLRPSPVLLIQVLVLFLMGVSAKALLGGEGPWLPEYFTFLLLTAYLPLFFFWKTVQPLVNWQALSLTVLYTLVTSLIWELSLGVPLLWWGYQKSAMLGLWVRAWQESVRVDLPIEAVTVWMVAPFACVFFFELIRALHYHPAGTLTGKLFGSVSVPGSASPPERKRRQPDGAVNGRAPRRPRSKTTP